MQNGLDNLARVTEGDPLFHDFVVNQLKAILARYAHFYRRESDGERSVLTAEYVMAARNTNHSIRPAYFVETYAADVLSDPFALRRLALFSREEGQAFQKKTDGGPFWHCQMREMQGLCDIYVTFERKTF